MDDGNASFYSVFDFCDSIAKVLIEDYFLPLMNRIPVLIEFSPSRCPRNKYPSLAEENCVIALSVYRILFRVISLAILRKYYLREQRTVQLR